MKKLIKYAIGALVLIAGIVIGILIVKQNSVDAEAGGTLPGIEAIVNSNRNGNAFTIIEVVSNKSNASIGYLVGGEEPVGYRSNGAGDYVSNGKSLLEMPSNTEREMAMSGLASKYSSNSTFMSLLNAGAISYNASLPYTEYSESGEGRKLVTVRGYYTDNATATGDYSLSAIAASYTKWVEAGDASAPKYKHVIRFGFGGTYGITLGYIYDASCLKIEDSGEYYYIEDKYRVAETSMAGMTLDAVKAMNNQLVYLAMIDAMPGADTLRPLYQYAGTIKVDGENVYVVNTTNNDIAIDEYIDSDSAYCFLSITADSEYGNYCVRKFDTVNNGNFSKSTSDYVLDQTIPDEDAYALSSVARNEVTFTPGAGTKDFNASYSSGDAGSFYYANGLSNSEWLKAVTFDADNTQNFLVDVVTLTMDEFCAMDNFSGVGLVYLTAGAYSDMTDRTAKNLINGAISGLPVVLETGFDSSFGWSTNPNNYKVQIALRQSSVKSLSYSNIESNWTNESFWTNLASRTRTISPDDYIYVDSSVLVWYGSGFVSGDFISSVTDRVKENGLSVVKSEIDSENFYRRNAGIELISSTISKATALRYIINFTGQRVVVKNNITVLEIEPCYSFGNYINNSGNYSDVSLYEVINPGNGNKVHVSNINRRVLSEYYIANNWATQFRDSINKIKLVQTSSAEFIGRVEDLNETYDLIYIGLDTSTMNTVISGSEKTVNTVYNDSNMNKLIYTHVGDTISDTSSDNKNYALLYWDSYPDVRSSRLSGNDITVQKLYEIEQFVMAGYPVVFADDFFVLSGGVPTAVRTEYIDVDSNMYQLGLFILGYVKPIKADGTEDSEAAVKNYFVYNAFYDSQVSSDTDSRNRLAEYMNISKLSVELSSYPPDSHDAYGNAQYMLKRNGKYMLEYRFTLTNEAAVSVNDTKYNVELYIDTSVDGRYTEEELIPSIQVYEVTGSGETIQHLNAAGKYELMAGKEYILRREVPTGYTGVLPWKLVFSQNGASSIRKSVTGYTTVPIATENKTKIKVLQITTAEGSTVLFGTSYEHNNLNLKEDRTVQRLLNDVQDFELDIQVVSSYELLGKTKYSGLHEVVASPSTEDAYFAYLDRYDMIIFGFSDCFEFGNTKQQAEADKCAKAVTRFIDSGKIVLFTHDTTSFYNRDQAWYDGLGDFFHRLFGTSNSYWGYSFNRYLRSSVGMDRFNALGKTTVHDTYSRYSGRLDNLTQGYSNIVLWRMNKILSGSKGSSRAVFYGTEAQRGGQETGYSYSVSKMNEGQITTYPFVIPDTFSIANTHGQYYQLNLDTLAGDDKTNDDIVVWYCISNIKNTNGTERDDIYQATYKDARNNYYIYSKGNVMYSGVGHSSGLSETEIKLFINTMVAAYQSTGYAPNVSFLSGEANSFEVAATYLPVDENTGDIIDSSYVELYFRISDTSFIQGTRTLTNGYYIETDSGEEIDGTTAKGRAIANPKVYRVKVEKKTVGGKEVTETSYEEVTDPAHLALDTLYCIRVPSSEFATTGNLTHVLISAKTSYTLPSGKVMHSATGVYEMSVIKPKLFDLE